MTRSLLLLAALATTASAHPVRGGDGDADDRPVWRHPRPHDDRPSLDTLRTVTNACSSAMFGQDDTRQCTALAMQARPRFDVAATIRACSSAMYGDADTLSCIGAAAGARQNPVSIIQACSSAMYGDADTLSCIGRVANARQDAAASIRECSSAMYGDADTLSCLDAVEDTRFDVGELVSYCQQQSYGDDQTLGRATPHRRRGHSRRRRGSREARTPPSRASRSRRRLPRGATATSPAATHAMDPVGLRAQRLDGRAAFAERRGRSRSRAHRDPCSSCALRLG